MLNVSKSSEQSHYLNALIYGEWGAGKTTLAASAEAVPEMGDVLYIDAESGSMSLSHLNIDVIKITNYRQFAEIYDFLRLHCRYRDAGDTDKLNALWTKFTGQESDSPTYKTVVIDSLTEIQKLVMYQLLAMDVGEFSLNDVPSSPQFKEWNQQAEMLRLLIRSFRNLPMHTIIVCGEQETEDERKRLIKRPALSGKLAMEVQGYLDLVGYLATRQKDDGMQRVLFMQNTPKFTAKHRFSKHQNVTAIESPTMAKIFSLTN